MNTNSFLTANWNFPTSIRFGAGRIDGFAIGVIVDNHRGLTNAIFLPCVLTFNHPAIAEKMQQLALYLLLEKSGFDGVLDWILELRTTCGIPHTLSAPGIKTSITDEHIDKIIALALADPAAATNPVPVTHNSLKMIFNDGLTGLITR